MHTGTFPLTTGDEIITRAWVRDASEASGPCVLFLHGVESHSEWFDEVAAYLNARGADAFAFDRPGWGRSKGARGHLTSYADAVRAVSEVATSLRDKYGNCHLAGLSWGGLLALYAALRRGPLFDSVTLIAPGICSRTDLSFANKLRVARGLISGKAAQPVPLAIEVEQFTKRADRARYIREDEHRVTSVSAAFCLETLKMRRFSEESTALRRLPPAQLLLAGRDAIIDNARTTQLLEQATCRAVHGNPPAAVRVETFANAEHSLVFEAPERTATAILDLAASVSGRSESEPLSTSEEQPATRAIYLMNATPIADASADPAEPKTASGASASDSESTHGKRVAIMGAGAIGSLVGGLLALGGHRVTLIGRQAHADAVNERGLTLRLPEGRRTIREGLSAVTSCEAITDPQDLVVLAVKGFDTAAALESMRSIVSDATVILSLQNGLENEALIADAFPKTIILAGAICAYTEFNEPGVVSWCDDLGGLAAGVYQGDDSQGRVTWSSIAPDTGMQCLFVTGRGGALRVKWSKLLLNVAFNALNAATGLPTHEILAHPEYGLLAARALREGFAVMRAKGIAPVDLPGYPVTKLATLSRLPAGLVRRALAWKTGRGASGASSMRQDLARRRGTTEIDAINGAVVQAGAACGIPTPANDTLCRMVQDAADEAT